MVISADRVALVLARLREKQPVVHAITNWVTASDVANALHAIGARPVMASAPEEVEEIVSGADALVLNLGTPDPSRVKAMLRAGHHANKIGRPVIFDPVGVGASRFRVDAAQEILSEIRVTVIRGNRAEVGALSEKGGELRGIDAVAGPPDLVSAAKALSRKRETVVTVSGSQDLVVSNEKVVFVDNGHPMMGRVTGMGCMLTGLIGAFAAVETDPVVAAIGAVAFFGLAGERAALQAKGPGYFKVKLLDALYELTPEDLEAGARLKG